MFRSIQVQLNAIFLGFLLIVITWAIASILVVASLQIIFFAIALIWVAFGYFVIRRRMVQPVTQLRDVAAHYNHQSPSDDDELTQLSRSIELMRTEIAEAHAQMEVRVAKRTHELTSAFELSQEIIAQIDLQDLLRSATDRARALTHADAASLCLIDQDHRMLILSAGSGSGALPTGLRQPIGFGLYPADQVIDQGLSIATETACTNCGFLHARTPGQCAAVPLRVGDHTLGALCVVRDHGPIFDTDETRALTLLANSAAIAIVNARLIEDGRRQAEQAAAVAEREHLAAELHDHIAQTLGFLKLKIDQVKDLLDRGAVESAQLELDRMQRSTGDAFQQVRAALTGLREPLPTAEDLAEKISACLADFKQATGMPAELIINDQSALALAHVAQSQALLIVREALNNVRRHAQATQVWVRIDRVDGEARFSVEDNGRGFVSASIDTENHLGVSIMRTRAERSHGYLTIDSAPGAGTKVTAHFGLTVPSNIAEAVRV
jgi:two-component system, NarL family, nitrate/nitrite sensor histidine kinase NarX